MATPKNDSAGAVDVNMIWNRASDLHQENPLSVSRSQTLFSYVDLACDTSDTEDDDSNILYIQECLSEILGDIPKLHQHQEGKWSISPQPASEKMDGLGSLSYFGIPITGKTGFTNTDSILKFVTSRTSETLQEPQPSPIQESKSSHSTNQENIDPQKGKSLRNRGHEGSFAKLEKTSLPEILSCSRDINSLATDGASSLLRKEPRINPVHSTPQRLKNNRVVVFESDASQLEERPSSRENTSLKGNSFQADKAPSNENMRKKFLEENNLLKNVLKSNVLENKKHKPSQNLRDPVINNTINVKERSKLPKQESRISVFDRLDCRPNISNNTEMSLAHTAESTDSPKQVLRNVSLEEQSDLEIIYETVQDIDLDISFQNLSMYEEDDDGLNKSNYIVLDETVASVDESRTNITLTQQAKEDLVKETLDEEDINERVNMKLPNKSVPEENINQVIETNKEKDDHEEAFLKEVSDKDIPTATTIAENKSSADTEQLNCKVTEEPSQTPENETIESEVIKPYMLPFISDDPEENKDNEDPRWDYLKKLETDEARYQLCRKHWKSLVVPDPNTNLTYFGFLKSPNTKNTPESKGQTTKKRQREPEEEQSLPPKKRSRNVLSFDFTEKEIEKQKHAVTRDYNSEFYKRRCRQSRFRLRKAYLEKMEQLNLAQTEIITRHKFYIGLPDQNLSVCQADVEQEFKAMEHHYEKYKTIYHWNERALFV